MKEELLQYAWMFRQYLPVSIADEPNTNIEVIDPGQKNQHSGPDFFNAKIRIGNTVWAGNIEIHFHSSHWYTHKHHLDKAYNNVILHVVLQNDEKTYNQKGETIPTVELNIFPSVIENYNSLISQTNIIACGSNLHKVSELILNNWLEKQIYNRLEQKYMLVESGLTNSVSDWKETFYQIVSRTFGMGVNALPFEMLSKSIPYKTLMHYAGNVLAIEALLLGQAGFLSSSDLNDEYEIKLRDEYQYLAKKHNLTPIDVSMWKFARMRPDNFPVIRIAQLATLINKLDELFSEVISLRSIDELRELLDCKTGSFWEKHYRLGKPSKKKHQRMSNATKDILIINGIVPVVFAYGKKTGSDIHCEYALALLERLKPEKNSIINQWNKFDIKPRNAAESQALIYLYNHYCKLKKCIHCPIGHKLIAV
jgi:hypothetical protein